MIGLIGGYQGPIVPCNRPGHSLAWDRAPRPGSDSPIRGACGAITCGVAPAAPDGPPEGSEMIRVEWVELREIHLPLVHFFETSFGRTYQRKIVLLTARAADGVGYGECTAGEQPLYSSETTETAWHVLSDFILPRVLGRPLESARDVAPLLAPIRGHEM